MRNAYIQLQTWVVAPFAGAWIEIFTNDPACTMYCVAPSAGAWIEMNTNTLLELMKEGRSLRGSVD